MVHTRDLSFISKEFETIELPKEKKYLLKYFDTVLQDAFLKYVFVFGEYANFVDHTGYACRTYWLDNLYNRLRKLETLHKQARANMDMQTLVKIETGKYKS